MENSKHTAGIGEAPLCMNCRHFNFNDLTAFTCAAFPEGIPPAIIENRADHRAAISGDHGLKYNPIDAGAPIPGDLEN